MEAAVKAFLKAGTLIILAAGLMISVASFLELTRRYVLGEIVDPSTIAIGLVLVAFGICALGAFDD